MRRICVTVTGSGNNTGFRPENAVGIYELVSSRAILRFGFFAQKSILPLDLAQPKELECFFTDEKKCRKFLARSTDSLADKNLDLELPRRTEYDNPETDILNVFCSPFYNCELKVPPDYYFLLLTSLVQKALERSDRKLEIIKFFFTFNFANNGGYLSVEDVNDFANYMYPHVTDSAFVKAFLKRFELDQWIIYNDKPEILEYFLYHLHQNGQTFRDYIGLRDPIEGCILTSSFSKISSILKYQDAPQVPSSRILPPMSKVGTFIEGGILFPNFFTLKKRMIPRRFHLISDLLFIFFKKEEPFAAECLRLLWHTLPDAFFSLEEMKKALSGVTSLNIIEEAYNFYYNAVWASNKQSEPRSLQQLCRAFLRRKLCHSSYCLPGGIKQSGLPQILQSFLRLEE